MDIDLAGIKEHHSFYYNSIFTFTFLPIQMTNIYYDYLFEQTMFYIVLSFEQTIEQCTCIVFTSI